MMNTSWSHIRKFLVFQFKLYIDAFRDLFLSLLSFVAILLDLVFQSSGPDSFFERVLVFGRRTEEKINLFNQYDVENGSTNVDTLLKDVERRVGEKLKKESAKRKTKDDSNEG